MSTGPPASDLPNIYNEYAEEEDKSTVGFGRARAGRGHVGPD